MSTKQLQSTLFALSICGTAFAGYLSAQKYFFKVCALNEGCPRFLGYPACYFGFLMFSTLLVSSLSYFLSPKHSHLASKIILGVSILGILFAGSFVFQELVQYLSSPIKTSYQLILPSCAYGLIFYISIFVFDLKLLRRSS